MSSLLVYSSTKGTPVTNSVRVAKAFNKSHKAVLKALANLDDDEFNRLNFAPITYIDGRNRVQRAVMMTKAGFTFLVMGFTGARAAGFKQQYIHQFDLMQAQLEAPQPVATPLTAFTRPDVQVEQIKATGTHLFGLTNNPGEVTRHHRTVMQYLTARTPSQYVRDAVARGLRVASLSGRQVLRRLEPAKAATAAFMDEQVQRGHSLEQMAAAGIPQALPAAFEAMLRAGITPAELSDS